MPKVVITQGPGSGTTYELEQAAILGRLDSNDIPVKDTKASREHAKIYKQGERYAIVDLNSSNGTYVNGAKITKQMLDAGDVIEIGTVRMEFQDPEAELAKQAASASRKSLDDAFGSKKAGTKAPVAAAGSSPGDIVMRGHQPLQYNRVKPGMGLDMDQMSDSNRFLVYLGVGVIFAILVYIGYTVAAG